MAGRLTIAIGADHGGYILKEELKKYLAGKKYVVKDFGTNSIDSCDYPLVGYEVAKAVSRKKADFGIAICKTGFGMAIVANKVKGIRSAVCDSPDEAMSARLHNDCNVLSLAAKRVKLDAAEKIVDLFLSTGNEGGRHKKRVMEITEVENEECGA